MHIILIICIVITFTSINGQTGYPKIEVLNKTNQGRICDCTSLVLCKSPVQADVDPEAITTTCTEELAPCCKSGLPPGIPTSIPKKIEGCGVQNQGGFSTGKTGDMYNHKALIDEFPWMVAVLSEETVEGSYEKLQSYQCGASLIQRKVVLTSANCVNSKGKQFSVRAGLWDSQDDLNDYPDFAYQDRNVEKIIIHPDFNINTLENDAALLILDKPVRIVENADIVCLPAQNEVVLENATCFYSSWNKDTFGKKGIHHVPIIQQDNCQERLRRTRLGNKFVLHKSFICSGKDDTCNGPKGSPFVCSIPGETYRFYQIGIASWGFGCVETPIVYSNVASFRNWIDNEMFELNYDTSVYTY